MASDFKFRISDFGLRIKLNQSAFRNSQFVIEGRCGWIPTSTLAALLAVLLAAGGGVWWWNQRGGTSRGAGIMLHTVERDDFELTITERGEIESYDVTEVRSEVKSNNTAGVAILELVPEGALVEAGDFLVQLDASALDAQRLAQQILVNGAKALEVEAKNTYDTAVIAKREYLEGTYLQERQLIESEAFVAEENLNRAQEYYIYSQRLASKGYVNENQLEADRFAVEKAKKDLQTAKTKLRVLDEFTKPKQETTLESAIQIALAKWKSAQSSHELELQKLRDIEDQIAKCTLTAPKAGIVKYAHQTDRGGDQEFIVQEGAIIREGQTVIRLPNAESMQVELKINESLIQYVRPGLPALITPVGMSDRPLRGIVRKVNQYAEPSGWRRANVKEYEASVRINDPTGELRPGLTASVTIKCDHVPDALQVPVQSLYAHGDTFYAFVYDASDWSAREVKPGPTNDRFFVIESGLEEGEKVALNPRQYLDEVTLPRLPPEAAQRAVPQDIDVPGEAVPQQGPASGPGAPSGPGGRPGGPRPAGSMPTDSRSTDASGAPGSDTPAGGTGTVGVAEAGAGNVSGTAAGSPAAQQPRTEQAPSSAGAGE